MKFDDLYKSIINEADESEEMIDRGEGSFKSDVSNAEKDKESLPPKEDSDYEFPELSEENIDLLNKIKKALSGGAKFSSFIYKTNGTANIKNGEPANGPTKIYNVNLGISYPNIVAHNKPVIEAYEPKDEWQKKAKEEMIASLSKSSISNREEDQGKKSVYKSLNAKNEKDYGIRYNTEKKCLNIFAKVIGAQVVADGQQKHKDLPPFKIAINKDGSPKGGDRAYLAKAKKEIKYALGKELRSLESFDLDFNKIAGIKVSGDMIEFHADGKEDMRA